MRQEEDFDANLAGDEGKSEETKTTWFKRIKKGILTSTAEKKETPTETSPSFQNIKDIFKNRTL